jgi:hypothetical protein
LSICRLADWQLAGRSVWPGVSLLSRAVRQYGPAQTPYARVLAAAEVSAEAKARLQALHATLNPFQLARDIERQKKAIEARRRLPA